MRRPMEDLVQESSAILTRAGSLYTRSECALCDGGVTLLAIIGRRMFVESIQCVPIKVSLPLEVSENEREFRGCHERSHAYERTP